MTEIKTTTVDAIYQNGSFMPLTPVALRENERVQLDVKQAVGVPKTIVRIYMNPESIPLDAWLSAARKRHADFVAKHGFLLDSTADIANDRLRDV